MTGFKRAKRKWLGYTTRAILTNFWDRWRGDAESERISRQVCARSALLGARKLLIRLFSIWKLEFACTYADRKFEAVVCFKRRKHVLRSKAIAVKEWRTLSIWRRWWRRSQARILGQYCRSLRRHALGAWHATSSSSILHNNGFVELVINLRCKSRQRDLLMAWRSQANAVRLLLDQVPCCSSLR